MPQIIPELKQSETMHHHHKKIFKNYSSSHYQQEILYLGLPEREVHCLLRLSITDEISLPKKLLLTQQKKMNRVL